MLDTSLVRELNSIPLNETWRAGTDRNCELWQADYYVLENEVAVMVQEPKSGEFTVFLSIMEINGISLDASSYYNLDRAVGYLDSTMNLDDVIPTVEYIFSDRGSKAINKYVSDKYYATSPDKEYVPIQFV